MELALTLALIGFEPVQESRLNTLLPQVTCDGATAFRDAVIKGNQLMLQLYALFCKNGVQNHYKFVHVVLTDGEDNKSQVSLTDFLKYQLIIQETLPQNILQTFYIGVNVENNSTVQKEMQAILQCSGKSTQYYPINSNGINDIFQKIQMQIGIRVQERGLIIANSQAAIALKQQTLQPTIQFQVNEYIVLFTLDVSGSMASNWYKVCNAVKSFLGNLGPNDIVLGIIFNDQVKVLTAIQQQQQQQKQIQYQPRQSQYQPRQSQYQPKQPQYQPPPPPSRTNYTSNNYQRNQSNSSKTCCCQIF